MTSYERNRGIKKKVSLHIPVFFTLSLFMTNTADFMAQKNRCSDGVLSNMKTFDFRDYTLKNVHHYMQFRFRDRNNQKQVLIFEIISS